MKNRISQRAQTLQPSMSLAVTAKAEELRRSGIDVISLSVGEPDFDTPDPVKEAAIDAMRQGKTKYTQAQGTVELRETIVNRIEIDTGVRYDKDAVTVANGAKHSIINALLALLDPEDEAIILSPYWVSYPEMVRLCGATPVIIDTEEEHAFKVTVDALERHTSNRTKVLLLNAPSNPTGSDYTKEELEKIADWAVRHQIFILSDEIYSKLLYEGSHTSIASISDEVNKLTIMFNGVSKAYAMTGWRIGYAAGPKDVIKAMNGLQSQMTSNPNSIAQAAAIRALQMDDRELEPMIHEFMKRRDYCVERIRRIPGMRCSRPDGAFYLFINVEDIYTATVGRIRNSIDLASFYIEEAKVAVIPGIGFGRDGYIRISYATDLETLKRALDRIEDATRSLTDTTQTHRA